MKAYLDLLQYILDNGEYRIKGYFDIAVTDILINEEGIVEEVYYAKKDVADHFPFDKVKEFSLR